MIATHSFLHIVLTPIAASRPSPTHLPPVCLRLLGFRTVPEDPKRFSCGVFDSVAYSYNLMDDASHSESRKMYGDRETDVGDITGGCPGGAKTPLK
jgi:hypothetical protein